MDSFNFLCFWYEREICHNEKTVPVTGNWNGCSATGYTLQLLLVRQTEGFSSGLELPSSSISFRMSLLVCGGDRPAVSRRNYGTLQIHESDVLSNAEVSDIVTYRDKV